MPIPIEKGWDSCGLAPCEMCVEIQIFSSQTRWLPFSSSSHLLILEAANCETKVAGKALCVCKKTPTKLGLCGSILQSFLLQSFPLPCVCLCLCPCTWVPICYKWLCPFSSGCQNEHLYNVQLCA